MNGSSAAKVNIDAHLMGKLRCESSGKELSFVSSTSQKAARLFILLLMAEDKGLSRRQVEELLYAEGDADFPSSYKSLLARLRKLLAEQLGVEAMDCLLLNGGVLSISGSIAFRTDVSDFEHAHDAAFTAKEESERIRCLIEACGSYGGELLPTLAGEPWVSSRNRELQTAYCGDVRRLHAYYAQQKDHRADYELCRRAVGFFPYEEEWVIHCMDDLHALGRHSQAMREYEEMSDRLYEDLGLYPSENMLDAIRRINDDLFSRSEAVRTLQETLSEDDALTGAYYCNYPAFLEHLKLIRRIARRDGLDISLVQLTVTDGKGRELTDDERILNSLSVLRVALSRSLRSSDLLTRLGRTRMLVLLWGTSRDKVEHAMERVTRAIGQEEQTEKCCVAYEILSEESVLSMPR